MRPIFIDRMWQFTASIGIARAPDHGASSDEIERRAALALRAARRSGRGGARRFEPQIETECAERRFLLQELESAIASQAFEVVYQAIVAADGGAVIGVEALLRWNHPTRGSIGPSVFIPLAEQSGLMSRLGEIVLRRALSDGARWPELSIAVNLSPLQIRDPRLVDSVAGIMKEAAIEPSRVVLELTEGVLIDNPQEAKACLDALRALGVRLALDDFGTGYSSLNYLQKFPFDRLKIDRSFVASLGKAGNSGAIVQSIVTLGHALGMKVLARGRRVRGTTRPCYGSPAVTRCKAISLPRHNPLRTSIKSWRVRPAAPPPECRFVGAGKIRGAPVAREVLREERAHRVSQDGGHIPARH